jgi:hypothetical protein
MPPIFKPVPVDAQPKGFTGTILEVTNDGNFTFDRHDFDRGGHRFCCWFDKSEGEDMKTERKLFEEWAVSRGFNIERDNVGDYHSERADDAWCVWKARVALDQKPSSFAENHYAQALNVILDSLGSDNSETAINIKNVITATFKLVENLRKPVEQEPSAVEVLKNDIENQKLGNLDKIYFLIEAAISVDARLAKLEGK